MLQQCTLFSSHYKHASPAFENLSNLVLNGLTSSSLTEFKHFYMSLWHIQGLQGEKQAGHCFHS